MGLALFGNASSAGATLIGDEVSCYITAVATLTCDDPSEVVNGSPEFLLEDGGEIAVFEVDIGASTVTLSYLLNPNFTVGTVTLELTSLDWVGLVGEIFGFSIVNEGIMDLEMADITTGPHSLTLEMTGWKFTNNDFLVITLLTRHEEVPEPTTLALFGIGLAGLGFMTRRRRNRRRQT